jgi:hypothetical protein
MMPPPLFLPVSLRIRDVLRLLFSPSPRHDRAGQRHARVARPLGTMARSVRGAGAMGIFQAQYPSQLQQVMDHAERFAALLATANSRSHVWDDAAQAWLTSRFDEIEAVVGALVADWQAGQLSERAAVVAISSYLRAMHAGADRRLGTARRLRAVRATSRPQSR